MTVAQIHDIHFQDGRFVLGLRVDGPEFVTNRLPIDLRDRGYRASQVLAGEAESFDHAEPHLAVCAWDRIDDEDGFELSNVHHALRDVGGHRGRLSATDIEALRDVGGHRGRLSATDVEVVATVRGDSAETELLAAELVDRAYRGLQVLAGDADLPRGADAYEVGVEWHGGSAALREPETVQDGGRA